MPDGTTGPKNGITGGYSGEDPVILRAMLAFTAIAWYNAAELVILVFLVFKRYSGLYFWSLLITSLAIIPYAAGAWTKLVNLGGNSMGMIILSSISWVIMVPGSSLVLYSRLHCITQNQRLLKGILWMIIINAICLTVPTNVFALGSNSSKSHLFTDGYAVMEKIQMTAFTCQEIFISVVYLIEVRRVLKVIDDGRFRKLMWELVAINVAIIILDAGLLAVEYLSMYQVEVTLKGMVYSIKLKLEFGVLSKLVKIATARQGVYNLDASSGSSGKDPMSYQGHGMWLSSPSTLTTLPSNNTYSTSQSRKSIWRMLSNASPFSGSTAVEKSPDVERGGAVSPTESIPKSLPLSQIISHPSACVVSRRSSTTEMYPGRLGSI